MTTPLDSGPTGGDSAVAQSSEPTVAPSVSALEETTASKAPPPNQVIEWSRGEYLTRAQLLEPHRRRPSDPLYRSLRIYSLDPTHPKLEGAVSTVRVPYEPLKPGPIGALFEIDAHDQRVGTTYRSIDLDDHAILLSDGVAPSPSNWLFHQQMVYAVASSVYNAFKTALGRDLAFGFLRHKETPERLRLSPYACDAKNAWYDPIEGAIRFGYFEAAPDVVGRTPPGGFVFTSLSHDIIAHEMSHALLDGLRSHFAVPTNPDVLAFHEGFSDVIAVLQHFSYPDVVHAAIRKSRGDLRQRSFLTDLAQQFGESTGLGQSLRTAVDFSPSAPPVRYGDVTEPHELGGVLVAAVFDAFTRMFHRKTEVLLRIASDGTGLLPAGDLPYDLQLLLARKASKIANQFLSICIRAIDYCPPVDITFGEFLRAVVTADFDLVPDDPWAYREAWLDAFGARGIFPSVKFLSEDALVWSGPSVEIEPIEALSFARLQFKGDPAHPMGEASIDAQACALAGVACARRNLKEFGLAAAGARDLDGDKVQPPVVHSIRSSRRIGPDGQIRFDLVAEIIQVRWARTDEGAVFPFLGGSTVITGPDGDVRYVVVKSVTSKQRIKDMRAYVSANEHGLWEKAGQDFRPVQQPFKLLHKSKGKAPSPPRD